MSPLEAAEAPPEHLVERTHDQTEPPPVAHLSIDPKWRVALCGVAILAEIRGQVLNPCVRPGHEWTPRIPGLPASPWRDGCASGDPVRADL